MKIFDVISNFAGSGSNSQESFELRREFFLREANNLQEDIHNRGVSIIGIAKRAESRLPDRSDCLFWIAKVCQKILDNDKLFRRVKNNAMVIHSLKCLLDCDPKSADDFAVALDRQVKLKQKLKATYLKNSVDSEKRNKEAVTRAIHHAISTENSNSNLEPRGIDTSLVVSCIQRINRAFPKSSMSNPLALLSYTLRVTHRRRGHRIKSLHSLLDSKLPYPMLEQHLKQPSHAGRNASRTLNPVFETAKKDQPSVKGAEVQEPQHVLLKFAQSLDSILRNN